MIYSYYSCKITDIKPIRRCLRNFIRNERYWGLFSFQPLTMTCIEKGDVDVLLKYEPYGLVMHKDGSHYMVIPKHIVNDYYDIYQKLLDPIKDELMWDGIDRYYVDTRAFKRRLRV